MSGLKCFSCTTTNSFRDNWYYCCNPEQIYCSTCNIKTCKLCKLDKPSKKYKVVDCKYCYKKQWHEAAFLNYKHQLAEEYYCYKCVKASYQKSSSKSCFLPFRKTQYEKSEIRTFLQLFCLKCNTKIPNKLQQNYFDEENQRYQCNKCKPFKAEMSQEFVCAICGDPAPKPERNDGLIVCKHCFNASVVQQSKIQLSKSKLGKKNKIQQKESSQPPKKQQNILKKIEQQKKQAKQQMKIQKIQQNGHSKEGKLQNKNSIQKQQSKTAKTANTDKKQEQAISQKSSPERDLRKRKDSQKILENVDMLMTKQDEQDLIQCNKCGYDIQISQAIDQKLCKGCYAIENFEKKGTSARNLLRERKPIQQPESRHFTKQKSLNRIIEPKTNPISKKSLYDSDYQMPNTAKFNIFKEAKKQSNITPLSFSSYGMTSQKKRCNKCGRPIAFPTNSYCLECTKLKKAQRR